MTCAFGVQGRGVRIYLAALDRPGPTVEVPAGAIERAHGRREESGGGR